jgi:OmpA-OmpF porin, OOP family
MKTILSTLFCYSFLFVGTYASGLDTLVVVNGSVIDAFTKNPVEARIRYELLPHGNVVGLFNSSTFSFHLGMNETYLVRIQAPGFAPLRLQINGKDEDGGLIFTEIELLPNAVGTTIRLDKLIFEQGKADITQDSYQELNKLLGMLQESPSMRIRLEGHTDYRGNEQQNMKLSQLRVEAVRDYLNSKGINKRRIETKAFGGSKPVVRSDDPETQRLNRRVEVRILAN